MVSSWVMSGLNLFSELEPKRCCEPPIQEILSGESPFTTSLKDIFGTGLKRAGCMTKRTKRKPKVETFRNEYN